MANENIPFTLHEVDSFGTRTGPKFSVVRMGPIAYLNAPREVAEAIVEAMNMHREAIDQACDAAYLRSTSTSTSKG